MANQTNNPFDSSTNQTQDTQQVQSSNVQNTPQAQNQNIAQPLTIDQILHFEPTSSPTQIANTEATRQNYIKEFGFDANVSLAQEQELKRIQESERIRQQAEKDQNVKSFVQNQTNARLTIDDLDNLNNISSGLNNFSGLKNASMNDIQMRTLKMNAEKYGGIYAQRYNELTQNPSIARNLINLANQNPLDQIKPVSNPQDNSKITPTNNSGNKYINAIASGSASLIQTGALAFDALGQGIYKGLDKLTGNDVANQAPYEPNKVYQALQNLKDQKYGQSDQLTTLMIGADQASKDAEKNGDSPLFASLSYLAKNGSLGDAGELIAQSLPSLALGFGAGGLAEKASANLLSKYAGTTVAQRVAIGSLADAQTNALGFIPKAVQGATIGGVSDFAGSLAPEFESQRQQGYDNSIALNRALTKSFAQAGVSSIGGSLLPFRFGGDVGTYIGQTALQGLTGYGSGYAGAKSIGDEYSSTDGAVNLLLGAITAIPEAIAVGGHEIRRSQIQDRIDDAISDRAVSQVEAQKAQDNLKSMYFGAGIKDLIDRVRSSKTNERTPDTMTDFINHLQDNDLNSQTDVYIDADKFNQLANDHELDLQSLFKSTPELQKEYQRANDIDGVMRIPMHEVLTTMSRISNEDYVKAFANSLRHDPEALTAGEAREQLSRSEADISNEVSQVKESFNNERKKQDDENYVTDSINNELKNLEYGFNSNFNNNAKTLVGAFYKQLADKTGVTQKELFDKMPLRFASDEIEAGNKLGQLPESGITSNERLSLNQEDQTRINQDDVQINSSNENKINNDPNSIDQTKNIRNTKSIESESRNVKGFNQSDSDGIRGQIVFRKDKNGAVIILGKNANFSTFAHELGHNFLEMTARFALRPDAPDQLKTDIETVMQWAKVGKNLDDWTNLTPEQRTEMHEKFAESFEQYMFEGKSPSNELRKVFASFRVFMTTVYSNIQKFLGLRTKADLNPEIRDVMDRMLASQEAIEQVQRQRNLEFSLTEEQATKMGISPKDYLIMKEENQEATEQSINDLEQKTMKDLARFRTIKAGHLKTFSLQQKRVRQQVREQVAEEVAQEPVYQAIAYLRQPTEKEQRIKRDPNKVDPEFDTMLDAIAKMGGINADEISKTWGTDKPESYKVSVGRTKKVARKDGLSIETVAERLAEDGYLSTDEHGKFDTNELEDKFTDSLSGSKFYSNKADFDKIQYFDSMGMAIKDIDLEQLPESGKLDLDWVKERYKNNPEVLEQIATTGKYGLSQKNGYDPDMIAEFMGYDSAEKMIADIVQSPSAKDEIERRSNELINAQHAELFDENSVQQAIDEAVHNDIRATILSRELATISKLNGNQTELNNITKNIAQNIINNSQVKDIRPHLFSAGELKNSKAYNNAIKKGETLEAVRAKRQQLINFHATRQAYKAQDFISNLQNLGKKINGNDKVLAKNRDFNLVAIARYLLDLYDISGNPSNYQEHIDNLKKYDPLASAQVADLIYTTDENGSTVNRVPVDSLNNLTFDQVQELDTMIRQIWHLSKANNKIMVGEKAISLTEAKDNLVNAMSKKKTRSRKDKILGYAPRTVKDFNPQRALQSLKRAEQFFTWLDDGKANGYFHQYIFNPMQDKLAEYRIEQRKVYKDLLDIYQEFTPYKGKIDASELGGLKNVFDSKQELLHAILHTGNESNKRRLVLGFGWGEKLEGGAVDYTRWNNFFNKMMDDGVITKQDMDSIQKIWNTFDKYKEMAQQTHKRLNGLYFKELPKEKLSTKWGEYEGGYIPADYDKLASVDAEQRGKVDPSTQDSLFMAGATTGANFTKSRADNFNGDQLTLDMTSLPSHIDRELRYIFLEEQLKQASKIFRNKDVLNKIESVSPYAIDGIISDWLTAVSNQSVNRRGEFSQFDRVVDNLKWNSGIVLMAGNIKNAVEVWTSVPQLMAVVPAKELASASAKFFTNAFSRQSMIKDIRELSPFMDVRFEEGTNQIRNEIESIVVNKSKFLKGSDFIKQHAYIVQSVFEKPFTAIGWMGAYNDAMGKGMSQKDAVYHADGVVRQYMNDMTPEGISKIERGTPLMRAMLMFYGWFNMLQNTWFTRNKLISERTDIGALNKMGRYAGLYMSMIALPAMLSKALTLSFSGELGNTDSEDKENADLVNIVVKSQAEMLMGMLPFLRDVLNPIYRTSTETTAFSDRYQVSPIISMGENLVKSGERTIKKLNDNDVSNSAYTKNLLQSATFATGIPFTLAQRPASYGVGVATGEIQPKDNADIARGLVNGK